MIWIWIIVTIKYLKQFFWLPKPEAIAERDPNARCLVCGHHEGELRCVRMIKPGPRAADRPAEESILCQHRCKRCGARWFEKPLLGSVTTSDVLPSVGRTEIEDKEDRVAKLFAPQP